MLKFAKEKKPDKKIMDNAHLYSRISRAVYEPTPASIGKFMRQEGIPGYEYLKKYSSPEIAVFRAPDNRIVVSSRGTTLEQGLGTAVKDLTTDVLLGFGLAQHGSRSKQLTKQVEKLVKIYGQDQIVMTGHSLGGTLAKITAEKLGLEAHVFNMGSTVAQAHAKLTNPLHEHLHRDHKVREDAKINNYHSIGDVISSGSLLGNGTTKHHVFDSKGSNAHSVDNFRKRKRETESKEPRERKRLRLRKEMPGSFSLT